jgi:hypothetical protein
MFLGGHLCEQDVRTLEIMAAGMEVLDKDVVHNLVLVRPQDQERPGAFDTRKMVRHTKSKYFTDHYRTITDKVSGVVSHRAVA